MPLRFYQLCLGKILQKIKSIRAEQSQMGALEAPVRRSFASSTSPLSDLGATPELTDDELIITSPQSLGNSQGSDMQMMKQATPEKFPDDPCVEPPADHWVEGSIWYQSSLHPTRVHKNDRQVAASKNGSIDSIDFLPALPDNQEPKRFKQIQPSPSERVQKNSRRSRAPSLSPEARSTPGANSSSAEQPSAANRFPLSSRPSQHSSGLRSVSGAASAPYVLLIPEEFQPSCKFCSARNVWNASVSSHVIQLKPLDSIHKRFSSQRWPLGCHDSGITRSRFR